MPSTLEWLMNVVSAVLTPKASEGLDNDRSVTGRVSPSGPLMAPTPQHSCHGIRREVLVMLVAMKGRLSLYLVLAGTAMIVTGTIVTVALLVHRGNCDGVLASQVCQGYTNSIHWAYPVIALGVLCFIAAGLSATNLLRSDSPADHGGRERFLD